MPTAHFHTLTYLTSYWYRIISKLPNIEKVEKKITMLSETLGPLILRPTAENKITINDKHPQRLAKDLIRNAAEITHPDIISPLSPSSSFKSKASFSDDEVSEYIFESLATSETNF
jgi:hypothetical protein